MNRHVIGWFFGSAVFLAIIAGAIWLEIGVWQECRTTNSWFYCVRMMSK